MASSVQTPRQVPEDLTPAPRHEQDEARHPGIRQYVVVAVVLALATLAEVVLYYLDLPRGLLVGLLLFFAVSKFALVVLFFMHLKFDNPIFRRLFVTGLLLAITVYAVVLVLFGIRAGGNQG